MKKTSTPSLKKGCTSSAHQSVHAGEAVVNKARAAAAKQLVATVEPVSRAEATLIAMGIVAAG